MKNDQIPNKAAVGVAWMHDDGTLNLQLRVESGEIVGDTLLSYPPDHKDYQEILDHIGGLKAGEYKPVPPWPTDEEPLHQEEVKNHDSPLSPLSDIDRT